MNVARSCRLAQMVIPHDLPISAIAAEIAGARDAGGGNLVFDSLFHRARSMRDESHSPGDLGGRLQSLERSLTVVLVVAAFDTMYLTWRFTALFAAWVPPGSGLCSWTAWVDCDKVLQTPQARAFVVPNAVLGLGCYTGLLLWWVAGRRLGAAYRPQVIATLAVWLGMASLMTFWFWWLLLHLDALCPFCPWNHVLTYVALALALGVNRLTPRPAQPTPLGPLLRLAAVCVVWFWAWQGAWFLAEATVLRRGPSTAVAPNSGPQRSPTTA
jgi:uncharacterized membrane protein